jgi:hypothetical protein
MVRSSLLSNWCLRLDRIPSVPFALTYFLLTFFRGQETHFLASSGDEFFVLDNDSRTYIKRSVKSYDGFNWVCASPLPSCLVSHDMFRNPHFPINTFLPRKARSGARGPNYRQDAARGHKGASDSPRNSGPRSG